MKLTILVLFVVLLALAVVSVPANHHKKHRGNNVKVEEYFTTLNPIDGGNGDDYEWPEPERVRNVELPKAFGLGTSSSSRSESVSVKQHGRSRHGSQSH